jgi:hypothetical protein
MSVKFTKPEFDIREKISEIPTMGEAAKSLIQAESRKDQQYLLGISGRRNLIINGNFEIWQRGTSGTVVGGPDYCSADRWKIYVNTSTTMTLSRQDFSPGQTEVEGNPRYFGRFDWLGTGSTQFFGIEQLIEGCHWGSGDYITVSFYARTQTGEAITLGVNQKFGTSGSADQAVGNFAVATSAQWQKFVIEIPVPSIKGKAVNEADDSLSLTWYRNGRTDSYIDLAQVQVEVGKGATQFDHRSYAEEMDLCCRYFHVLLSQNNTHPYHQWQGQVFSGYLNNRVIGTYRLPTVMRAVPTGISKNLSMNLYSGGSNYGPTSSIPYTYVSRTNFGFDFTPATLGPVGHAYHLDVASGQYWVQAEL